MSCWCDGEDPGCETCHPMQTPARRKLEREHKKAVEFLLTIARTGRADGILQAARAYEAIWNALASEVKQENRRGGAGNL